MPTVIDVAGFQVRILLPPREHGPAHVHVEKSGAEVVITLAPVTVRDVYRMRTRDVITAVAIVEDHLELLLTRWREIHG